MSVKGNPYENPFAQSFLRNLEQERKLFYSNMKVILISFRKFFVLFKMKIIKRVFIPL